MPPPYGAAEAAALEVSLARFRSTADSLRSFHARQGRVSTKHKKLSEALISVADVKNQRHADQLLSSIKPQLEQTEQRLAAKIAQATTERFGPEPTTHSEPQLEPEPEREIWPEQDGVPTTQQLLQGVKTAGADIDLLDPTWLSRTVYIGGIAFREADPSHIRARVDKVGARQALAVARGGAHTPGIVVSISVRAKNTIEPSSWALVSYSKDDAAERLLEEQDKDIEHRSTGTVWHFLRFEPDRLGSYEARRTQFAAKKDAVEWEAGGMVRQVVKRFKENHEATEDDRTVWVGNIPDHIADDVSNSVHR
jgi:hypothetical protein